MPNMTIVAPCDAERDAAPDAADRRSPGADLHPPRQGRRSDRHVATPCRSGSARRMPMATGGDVLLVTTGITLKIGARCGRERWKRAGIGATVLHMPTVKPLDVDSVPGARGARRAIVVDRGAHHHRRPGRRASPRSSPRPGFDPAKRFKRIGIPDVFPARLRLAGEHDGPLRHHRRSARLAAVRDAAGRCAAPASAEGTDAYLWDELLNIVTPLHKRTKRDYLARMVDDKVHCMLKAKEYELDYWDGDRRYGYGGYKYDGRWKPVAEQLDRPLQPGPSADPRRRLRQGVPAPRDRSSSCPRPRSPASTSRGTASPTPRSDPPAPVPLPRAGSAIPSATSTSIS